MKKALIICIIILFSSCGPEPENKYLTYQNIGILSDMSSRITNKPLKDTERINKILQFFENDCVRPGEKIGDRSCIFFSTFSDKVIASIDIGQIKNLEEKQQFINSTGKYQNNGLAYQIHDFELKVKSAYSNTRNKNGLDLISILIEKIKKDPIIKNDTFFTTDGIDTTFVNYDNHIYIFTDGYLEYLNEGANSQFHFGTTEINKVRNYCINNSVDIVKALEIDSSLCLPIQRCKKNQQIHLHVLETHERDKNDELLTYKYRTGLRDNEILEAVWRKWAKESGFKSFEWEKY